MLSEMLCVPVGQLKSAEPLARSFALQQMLKTCLQWWMVWVVMMVMCVLGQGPPDPGGDTRQPSSGGQTGGSGGPARDIPHDGWRANDGMVSV